MTKIYTFLIFMSLVVMFITPSYADPAITIYGEASYTDSDVDLKLYADIQECSLLSFGVRVYYNPDQLTVNTAIKNEKLWYFGTSEKKYGYIDPRISNDFVVILGGKIDEETPLLAGVTGQKVLLGSISFSRKNRYLPEITLWRAWDFTYKNFVTPDKRVLDDKVVFKGVTFFN